MGIKQGSKGFVIAGTNSGCGKTSITLGLMALLKRKGYTVAPFKVGPDYIDPGHHHRVAGRYSRNLDGWMMDKEYNRISFNKGLAGCDLAVVEGVMGLFDGYDGKSESGSTAQMSKWLDLPVILVVNAQSMARSAAALVKGFEQFDPDLRFAGVIFNKVGSPRHLDYLKEALEGHVNMPCLGVVFRNPNIVMPERHLGLVTDDENGLSDAHISTLADMMEQGIDLDLLLNGNDVGIVESEEFEIIENKSLKHHVRIGVARDQAF
jgi:cobyrinic acid a,c-diamide synthase